MMDEKAREARRQYKAEWARRNRDKIREYQDRYWTKRAAEMERRDAGEAAPPERKSAGNG